MMAKAAASRGRDGSWPSKRTSVTYRTMWEAIRGRKQIVCRYDGRYREACPHILGYKGSGEEAVFVFQVGGESNSRLPPEGDWRCLDLDRITDLRLRDGPWRGGTRHSKPQACIQFVDVDVNVPDTLTHPEPLSFESSELRPPRRSGE